MRETYVSTVIGGIEVELQKYDSVVNGSCFKIIGGSEYMGSIATLADTGVLEDVYGNTIPISRRVIKQIVAWATEHGW